jgi:hypothetical protein
MKNCAKQTTEKNISGNYFLNELILNQQQQNNYLLVRIDELRI